MRIYWELLEMALVILFADGARDNVLKGDEEALVLFLVGLLWADWVGKGDGMKREP